ncbi:MAG: hypothetical protein FVQ85_03900 [Planctomycetes bacterium]|nr:hypothetical protein [Planctomycetota bacterium]
MENTKYTCGGNQIANKLFTNSTRTISISLLVLVSTVLAGCMSIHTAARAGNLGEVKRQLAWGVNPNTRTFWYLNTPLHGASAYGRIRVVKLLLAKGADVNKGNEGSKRPLHYAARHGHTKVMKILLEHGAKVTAKDKSGWITPGWKTPLKSAAGNGQIEAAKLLLAYGADINEPSGGTRDTPLYSAVFYNQIEMVIFLLANGANVNIKSQGCTALHLSYQKKYEEIARVLLEHGADPNIECRGYKIPQSFLRQLHK